MRRIEKCKCCSKLEWSPVLWELKDCLQLIAHSGCPRLCGADEKPALYSRVFCFCCSLTVNVFFGGCNLMVQRSAWIQRRPIFDMYYALCCYFLTTWRVWLMRGNTVLLFKLPRVRAQRKDLGSCSFCPARLQCLSCTTKHQAERSSTSWNLACVGGTL